MTFLYPGLLILIPVAVALVVLIHLLRTRRRTVAWGAWYFLAQAARKTRTRTRFHSFLLLLLRLSIPIAVILLLAGPVPESPSRPESISPPEKNTEKQEINLVLIQSADNGGNNPVTDNATRGDSDSFLLFALEAALSPETQSRLRIRYLAHDEISSDALADVDMAFMVATSFAIPANGPLADFLQQGHTLCLIPGHSFSCPVKQHDPPQTCHESDLFLFPVFEAVPELRDELAVFTQVDSEYPSGEDESTTSTAVSLVTAGKGQPVLDYCRVGRGTVVRFYTSWSERWSNLAATMTFPILIQELTARFAKPVDDLIPSNESSPDETAQTIPRPYMPATPVLLFGVALILLLLLAETCLANRPFVHRQLRKGGPF